MSKEFGIHLGTLNTVVCQRGRGVILREKNIVSLHPDSHTIMQTGSEALQTELRVPASAALVNPMYDSVRRLEAAEKSVRRILKMANAGRAQIALCTPSVMPGAEVSALLAALADTGCSFRLIDKSAAAAIGAGADFSAADRGAIVVHIGASSTILSVLIGGNIAYTDSIGIAGQAFTGALRAFVQERRHIRVDDDCAEQIKAEIGAVWEQQDNAPRVYRGLRETDGLPKNFRLRPSVLTTAFEDVLSEFLDGVCAFVDAIPGAEFDIASPYGLLLTGGGAKLRGLDEMLRQVTGMQVRVAENPEFCSAVGACGALSRPEYGALLTVPGELY